MLISIILWIMFTLTVGMSAQVSSCSPIAMGKDVGRKEEWISMIPEILI